MNKSILSLLLLCTIFFLSCSKNNDVVSEPVTDQERPFVDYDIVQGDDPFTFEFENKSENYTNVEWRFGDDSLSNEVSPKHVYARDGIYEVNLKATAKDGSTARKLLVIKIIPDSVATILAKSTGVDNTVKFTVSTDVPIKSLKWDFGDNSTSTDLSPVKSYENNKLFTAKLILTTEKGSVAEITRLVSSNGSLKDVTLTYLKNVGPKFVASERVGSRWGVVADWRVNDAVKQREGKMGGWDEWEGNSMSMESWGGEPDIINGKIRQTPEESLPAGQYYYALKFHDFQVKDQLYTVIAKGDEIPDVDKVETDPSVLGLTKQMGNGPLSFSTAFKLSAPSKVTFGFVSTFIQSDQNFKLTTINLYKLDE